MSVQHDPRLISKLSDSELEMELDRLEPGMPPVSLDEGLLTRLTQNRPIRRDKAGTVVAHAGDPDQTVFMLLEGCVQEFVIGADGRRLLTNEHFGPTLFGEGLLGNGVRCTTAVAADESRIVVLSRAEFLSYLASDSCLERYIFEKLALRIRTMTALVRALSLDEVHDRVARLLSGSTSDSSDRRHEPMTQQAMAERVGATRSMVNRVLKSLAKSRAMDCDQSRPAGLVEKSSGNTPIAHSLPKRHSIRTSRSLALGLPAMAQRMTLSLPGDLIDQAAQVGKIQHFRSGALIAREDDLEQVFGILVKGVVCSSITNAEGRCFVIGHLQSGEYFGETIIFAKTGLTTLTCATSCECILIERSAFLELLESRADLAKHLLIKMARYLQFLTETAGNLALQDVTTRVQRLLEMRAEPGPDGAPSIPADQKQQAIADSVGASRSMVNRVLRKMQADGLLQHVGGSLVIQWPLQGRASRQED